MAINSPTDAITWDDVVKLTTLSRPTIQRLIARDEFPKQKYLSPRRVFFSRSEVEEWLRGRGIQS